MKIEFNRILETIQRITNNSPIAQIGVALGALISNFFLPILPVIITCFGLILVDLYYGLSVAKRNKRIYSKIGWRGTCQKLKDTFTIIALVRGVELYILAGITGTTLVGAAATIIGLTELWSILENMNTINPNGPWRALGKYMKIKGSEVIGIDLDKLKDENAINKNKE